MYQVINRITKTIVVTYANRTRALTKAQALDKACGACVHIVRSVTPTTP